MGSRKIIRQNWKALAFEQQAIVELPVEGRIVANSGVNPNAEVGQSGHEHYEAVEVALPPHDALAVMDVHIDNVAVAEDNSDWRTYIVHMDPAASSV